MKVTYTFKESEERAERELFENASRMYLALHDMDNYLREIRKGWNEDTLEEILEKIEGMIIESHLRELN